MNSKGKSNVKFIATLLTLGACWATVYLVELLQFTFYSDLRDFLHATNTQTGLLMSIFGLGNIFGCPVGGWLADKFNYKILYVLSVALNGVFALVLAFFPSYGTAVFVYAGFAVATLLLNYPTHIKILRDLCTPENEGKIFGFNETFIGLFNIVISAIMMFVFGLFGAGVFGLKATIIANALISFGLAALIWVLLPNPAKKAVKAEGEVKEKKNFFRDFLTIITRPATWLVAMTIFSLYTFRCTATYFTPFFADVVGVAATSAGWMAIARNYGAQLVGAPFGGMLTDKLKSPSKVLIPVYILGIVGLIYIMIPNKTVSVTMLNVIVLAVALLIFIGRGAQYATMGEAGVPVEISGSTIGVAAVIGFSPDVFQFALFGHWMDTYGNGAYNLMFIYQAVILALGIVSALCIMRIGKKNRAAQNA